MDMKLLSATGTNLVSHPLSGLCTAGQTKQQLMASDHSEQRTVNKLTQPTWLLYFITGYIGTTQMVFSCFYTFIHA